MGIRLGCEAHLHQFVQVFLGCQPDVTILPGTGMDQQLHRPTDDKPTVGAGHTPTHTHTH